MDPIGPSHVAFWPLAIALVVGWAMILFWPSREPDDPFRILAFRVMLTLALTVVLLLAYVALNAWLAA